MEGGESPKRGPSLKSIAAAWLRVGVQSFGGGAVSLELIRREFCEKETYFTQEEFLRLWALSQVNPGVNQIALTVLIGRELRGSLGILVSLVAFLAPSVTITILLAWGYARIEGLKATQAALRAVIPATAGLGFATAYRMAVPISKQTPVGVTLAMVILALIAAYFGVAIFAVLISAGLIGAIYFYLSHKAKERRSSEGT